MAADIDPRFAFEAHEWPNGHYIHTIGGHTEDLTKFNYWLLYKLPDMPDPNKLPENKFINSVSNALYFVAPNNIYIYSVHRYQYHQFYSLHKLQIGVDEMIVETNYHYLYWYKKL